MKTISTVMMLLLITASAYANGIEGTWVAKVQGPDGGGMELTFVFKIEGGKLSGVVQSPNGDLAITNTKVNGNEFSFDVPFNETTIKHDCTLLKDDTISMKATGTPMGDLTLILTRKP